MFYISHKTSLTLPIQPVLLLVCYMVTNHGKTVGKYRVNNFYFWMSIKNKSRVVGETLIISSTTTTTIFYSELNHSPRF